MKVIQSPHLRGSQGQLLPSALIPFCALNSNLGVLGSPLNLTNKLSLPVCDKFLPIILEGKLCFSLNLDQLETSATSEKQTHGLTMLLDIGMDTADKMEDINVGDTIESLSLKTNSKKTGGSPRIYIDTLATFSDFREGKYSLHAVKKMTGTENFMKLPDNVKDCSVEPFEQCRIEKYMNTIEEKCNCIPWTLWDPKKDKVDFKSSVKVCIFCRQVWVLGKRWGYKESIQIQNILNHLRPFLFEFYRLSHFVCLKTTPA